MAAEVRPHQKLLRASVDRCWSLGTSSQRPSSPSRSAGFISAGFRTASTHSIRAIAGGSPKPPRTFKRVHAVYLTLGLPGEGSCGQSHRMNDRWVGGGAAVHPVEPRLTLA